MALATRCPSCGAIFRVGAEQLTSRGGMVRCGSCRHVFNAIGRLDYLEPKQAGADRPAPRPEAAPTEASHDGRRPAPQPPHAPADAVGEQLASAAVPALSRRHKRTMPAASASTTSLSAIEAGADSASTSAGLATGSEARADGAPLRGASPRAFRERRRAPRPPPAEVRDTEQPGQAPQTLADAIPEFEPTFLRVKDPRGSRAGRRALAAGCLFLVPMLVLQLALLFRASLIVHFPELQPGLAALCAPLSCTAQWPMHPELLAVVSSELQAVPGTQAMELDTVIRNRAGFPMALPAIELTLTNSLDHPVARKVFAPADYLSARTGTAPTAGDNLAAGADLSIRILFELPGVGVAGFVAYPFYP
ncbi:conserved hypothetical protein [Burkholderiales bacterium]|nr:conserved hypothetical protein [Burkholderiales bacterium]